MAAITFDVGRKKAAFSLGTPAAIGIGFHVSVRAAAQSRLLRALEDAAAQRTGSLLARLRALLRAFRVKITRAA